MTISGGASPASAAPPEDDRRPVLRQAVADDFPVLPAVGKTVKAKKKDGSDVLVTQLAADCTMSVSAGTPYKQNNRIYAYVNISRSSGCAGNVYVYGWLYRVNYGGGYSLESATNSSLSPGTSIYMPEISKECVTGWYTNWHSSGSVGTGSGINSSEVSLPCQMT